MYSFERVWTHQWKRNFINNLKGKGRQIKFRYWEAAWSLINSAATCTSSCLSWHTRGCVTWKKSPSHPCREVQKLMSSWGCLQAKQTNRMQEVKRKEEINQESCCAVQGGKGTGGTMSITTITANPAAVPWTVSATQDIDRHPVAALGIFKHNKSRPEIYLCSSASPDSFNSIQVTIFFRQEHLCTVPKLCQERKVCFKKRWAN